MILPPNLTWYLVFDNININREKIHEDLPLSILHLFFIQILGYSGFKNSIPYVLINIFV